VADLARRRASDNRERRSCRASRQGEMSCAPDRHRCGASRFADYRTL